MLSTSDIAALLADDDDNGAAEWAAYCQWSAELGNRDSDPECCVVCLKDYGSPVTGLCDACEANEGDALERDRAEDCYVS